MELLYFQGLILRSTLRSKRHLGAPGVSRNARRNHQKRRRSHGGGSLGPMKAKVDGGTFVSTVDPPGLDPRRHMVADANANASHGSKKATEFYKEIYQITRQREDSCQNLASRSQPTTFGAN